MNHMADIPVEAAYALPRMANREGLSLAGVAVLAEVERLLEEYRVRGRGGVIALRWARLFPGDLERLRDILGAGEVAISVAALAGSTIQETAIPCVWWLSHCNGEAKLSGHWIEIAEVPALLHSDRASIPQGLHNLRERAASLAGVGYPFSRDSEMREFWP